MSATSRTDEDASSVVIVSPMLGSDDGKPAAAAAPKSDAGFATPAKAESDSDADMAEAGAEAEAKNGDENAEASEDQNGEEGKEEEEVEEKEEEKIIVGMECDRKDLYQKWDMHMRFTWTERYPDDLEEAAEGEKTMKYAILVRNKKSYDSRKKLEVDSIVIQSPLLKGVLHKVLQNYPGVTIGLQRLVFSAPFKPFVHRWAQLTAALDSDEYDEPTRAHVKLLYDVLFDELRDTITALEDYVKEGVITFEHIWTIFQPETVVSAKRYGKPVAVKQTDQGNFANHPKFGQCFQLKCNRVDWDGSKFGFSESTQLLFPFVGTLPITELDCFPIRFHPDAAGATASLLARGRLFEKLAGYQFKMYRGPAVEQQQCGPALVGVDSRVIVDAFAYGKFNPDHEHTVKPLTKVDVVRDVQAEGDDYDENPYQPGWDDYDYNFMGQQRNDDIVDVDHAKIPPLTDEQLVLCTPVVKGYALRSKKWLELFVDSISDVVFSQEAFANLVLPSGHKDLILAFAQSQVRHKERFDDVITGKGKGIIMLLSGGPGIGKTLTAESVAEEMQVPLYVMSAGDLGVSSWDVERNLGQVLEMVAKWNAVLLLDECDVFLEARDSANLDRNKIVSIFLRTLEYYEGILFLTTNRVARIDPAFSSRIHVSLEYPDLDTAARRAVWMNFLGRCADADADVVEDGERRHVVTTDEVTRLAALELNGRQIKNVLKTANLLACHRGEELAFGHLKTVLVVEGHDLK